MWGLDLASQIFGLVGVAALAVPAYHINRYASLSAQLSNSPVRFRAKSMSEDFKNAAVKLQTILDEWKPWKAWALHIGTASTALSFVLLLVKDFVGK